MANPIKAHLRNGPKVTLMSGLCYMKGCTMAGYHPRLLSNQRFIFSVPKTPISVKDERSAGSPVTPNQESVTGTLVTPKEEPVPGAPVTPKEAEEKKKVCCHTK